MHRYDPHIDKQIKIVYEHSYGEESYGLVYELPDKTYAVYEIPQYGGYEAWDRDFENLEDAIKHAKSFT